MDVDETRGYIEHRLKCVGADGRPSFDAQAFEAIHLATGGIPRRINSVCDRLLLLGFLGEKDAFGAEEVAVVVDEIREESGTSVLPVNAAGRLTANTRSDGASESGFDIDLGRLEFESSSLDNISEKLGGLGQEQIRERLNRVEKTLLRLERVDLEILSTLQRLVGSVKRSQ
jgi:general secretion pathway protein A